MVWSTNSAVTVKYNGIQCHKTHKSYLNYSKDSRYPVHVSNITCYRLERKFKPSKNWLGNLLYSFDAAATL